MTYFNLRAIYLKIPSLLLIVIVYSLFLGRHFVSAANPIASSAEDTTTQPNTVSPTPFPTPTPCQAQMITLRDGTCEPLPTPTPTPPPCYYAMYGGGFMGYQDPSKWGGTTSNGGATQYWALVKLGIPIIKNDWIKLYLPITTSSYRLCDIWSLPKLQQGNVWSGPVGYFDSNCRIVSPKGRLCGVSYIGIMKSPISLLWDSNVNINDQTTLTTFPVSLDQPANYYTWKASNKAPLLVYDPNHEGKITSASQLLGNYFQKKWWDNGYNALASLDLNKDEEVRDEELKSLGLWFDSNRDGISQLGEIKRLDEVGVTALYYGPIREEAPSGDLYVLMGYERNIDGNKIYGSSVDWYAKPFNSKAEYIQFLNEQAGDYRTTNSSAHTTAEQMQIDSSEIDTTSSDSTGGISGTWLWSSESNLAGESDSPQGVLILHEKLNGTLTGTSLVQTPLQANSDKINSVVQGFPLTGKIHKDASGNIKLSFEITSQRGLRTITEAYILTGNQEIKGFSTTEIGVDSNNNPITIDYAWKARKM